MDSISCIFTVDFLFFFNESSEFCWFNFDRLIGSIIQIHRKMEKITFPQITRRWMFKMSTCQLCAETVKMKRWAQVQKVRLGQKENSEIFATEKKEWSTNRNKGHPLEWHKCFRFWKEFPKHLEGSIRFLCLLSSNNDGILGLKSLNTFGKLGFRSNHLGQLSRVAN